MDVRIESLIMEMNKYREEFRLELKNLKERFEKYLDI